MEGSQPKEGKPDEKLITLVILTSDGTQTWRTDFEKTAKVADVINAAVQNFGFQSNGNYELRAVNNLHELLRPERTIQSYHLKDSDQLILTVLGGGVYDRKYRS